MSNDVFPRLLPVGVNFFNGESPAPQKISGIFNYLQAAFYVLEGFLGNGIDYRVTQPQDRRMLYNVSAALGHMSKLYKPTNKLTSLEFLAKQFISEANALQTDTNTYIQLSGEKSLILSKKVNIPANMLLDADHIFGFEALGAGTVRVKIEGSPEVALVVANNVSVNGIPVQRIYSTIIAAGKRIQYIEVDPTSSIEFFSMYLAEKDGSYTTSEPKPYNVAYASDISNPVLWKVAKPCKWATSGVCLQRTCGYCIGNTYDTYTRVLGVASKGEPVCAGNYPATAPAALLPKDNQNNSLSYSADVSTNFQSVYTIQSPLLMVTSPYTTKFSPYAVHKLASNSIIPQNQAVVYDTMSGGGTASPVKYNMTIQSAGRPDIVFVNDIGGEITTSTDRIVILSGAYGVSEMLADLAENMSTQSQPNVAVYAD